MKIAVLGLGPSLDNYSPSLYFDLVIGVNDISGRLGPEQDADIVVCVDTPNSFSNEPKRLEVIKNCRPIKGFYGNSNLWSIYQPNFNLLKLAPVRGDTSFIDTHVLKSNNSTYVAVSLAYRLGAKEIVLYGVDFINHKHIKDKTLDMALKDFRKLYTALRERNVFLFVGSKESRLSEFIPISPNS